MSSPAVAILVKVAARWAKGEVGLTVGEAAPMHGRRDTKVASKMVAHGGWRAKTRSEGYLVDPELRRFQQLARQGKPLLQNPGAWGESSGITEMAAECAGAHAGPFAKLGDRQGVGK